jgi:hypothetical protein
VNARHPKQDGKSRGNGHCDPLPTGFGIGIGFGSRKGHPSVTQASPKRHPRETQGSIRGSGFVCNKS